MARRAARLAVAVGLAVAAAVETPAAMATFTANPSHPTLSVSSGTLAAPTSLSADCFILTPTRIRLNWTQTSSTWADGYEVFRGTVSGGPYTSQGTVSGRGTTTFDDTRPSLGTYFYVVRATKNTWRSANSNQAQTPGVCLL